MVMPTLPVEGVSLLLGSDLSDEMAIMNPIVYDEPSYEDIYNTCALSKHMGNMCMRLRNAGKGEALPSLFPRFVPNTHIYLYASTVHMYCIYPAILNRK